MPWTAKDMPSLEGRTAIVTGANSGIGFETAKGLAEKGATVILACRDRNRGEAACARIRALEAPGPVACMPLDLADLASVSDFAGDILARHARLDLLVNNAGVMAPPRTITVDGFELQMATNHLGHFALTGLLFERLLESPSPRIVVVSSCAHKMGNPDVDDLQWTKRRYCRWKAYGDSKIANLSFAHELHRRYGNAKTALKVTTSHPGWTATNLQRTTCLRRFNGLLAMEPWQGALPTLYAATGPGLRGGEFIGPDGCLGLTGYPTVVRPNARSQDRTLAARLWEKSEELTGVRYAAH